MHKNSWVNTKKFALVVVNYGSCHLLEKNLSGLDLAGTGGQIVIVDNFTNAAEIDQLQKLATTNNWTVLALESNQGFGAAVNAGAKHALHNGAESLVVLNPDARIELKDLLQLLAAVGNDPALMVSPLIKTSEGNIWFDGMELYTATGRVASGRRRARPSGPREPWISGACFAISQNLWEKVGGFDEDYFLYWEDVDLSRRVAKANGRLAVLPDALAIHDPGGTQTSVPGAAIKSEIYYFYNIRNRLLYAAKHLDGNQLRAWVYATPRVSYEILCGGGRRQFLSSMAPFRAYALGILEGYKMLSRIRKEARAGSNTASAALHPAFATTGWGRPALGSSQTFWHQPTSAARIETSVALKERSQ